MKEMNAEQRAKFLFDLFDFIEYDSKVKTFMTRKSCALILVQELMKDVDIKSRDFIYWSNVKLNLLEL
jgi:hypothetical protein